MKATWSVVVLYQDTGAQETAVAFCDRLMQKFWAEFTFEVSWCSFAQLEDSQKAEESADKGSQAHLVIFATHPDSGIPLHVRDWAEHWLAQRQKREGALIGLSATSAAAGCPSPWNSYLRSLAHRAGVDFLTEVPHDTTFIVRDSAESCKQRAHQMTSLLQDILQRAPPSSRPPF